MKTTKSKPVGKKPAQKSSAPKSAPDAGDEVLQERTGKLIVRDGATVLKIFGPEY